MAVVLIATLDTKGRELAFVREIFRGAGLETLVVDVGSLGPPVIEPDITREDVFRRAGSFEVAPKDRGEAVAMAARGIVALIRELDEAGRVDGVLAIGGSAGTVIGTAAMRALPFGCPKVMVSTVASGQVRPYVGGSDITLLHPVVDIAGLNRFTRTALSGAAHALVGMVRGRSNLVIPREPTRPVIAATMFGVTTACVDKARELLETAGCEVVVFHATGVGGQAMEGLIRDGLIDGVLDLTTTELADELVGGILSAGPNRLEAAGRRGIPQVVSLGALDMVNFGPESTVPEKFRGRRFHIHNDTVTLMRTTPEENAQLGERIAVKLGRSTGPVVVLVPRGGISAIDAAGGPFHDPHADAALFDALACRLGAYPQIRLIEREEHINDPSFAAFAARSMLELLPAMADKVCT